MKPQAHTAFDPALFADLFPELQFMRGQKAVFHILESSARVYARKGFARVVLGDVADAAGVTRPSLTYYFKDQRELFLATARYIRARFQRLAIEAIQKFNTPEKMLEAYVRSTFIWARDFRDHARTWALFLSVCVSDKGARSLNSRWVTMGTERITALIEFGIKQGVFKPDSAESAARQIQIQITGALWSLYTEDDLSIEELEKETLKVILQDLARVQNQ